MCDRAEEGHRRATTRGNELMKLGEWRSAEACYLAALRHKRDFPMALYGLGEAHAKHEDRYDLSVHAYELAIQLWPQYVDARVALGDAHLRRGYKKRARRAYAAVGRRGGSSRLGGARALYLDDAVRDYEQASVTYRRAAAVPAGGRHPACFSARRSARGAEKWSECGRQSRQSRFAGARVRARAPVAGACRLGGGDAGTAIVVLRDAIRLDAVVSVDAYTSLATALVELGKDAESSAVLDQGVAAFQSFEKSRRAERVGDARGARRGSNRTRGSEFGETQTNRGAALGTERNARDRSYTRSVSCDERDAVQ